MSVLNAVLDAARSGAVERTLVGAAVVIDMSGEVEKDAGFLLEVDRVRAWEAEHGPLPQGGWLLYRTGWDVRGDDPVAFADADENGPHTPGVSPECARWLAEESPLTGLGVEAVGGCRSAVAGAAASFERAAHDRVLALVER